MRHISQSLLVLLACIGFVGLAGCSIDELLDDSDSPPSPDEVAEAALASKPARTTESYGPDVHCYEKFATFRNIVKKSSKMPPTGYQWHHIVNQNPTNKKRFGKRLHCTDNLISLERRIHQDISAHYSSKQSWTKNQRVREVINERSWSEQYEYGLGILRKHGINP